MKILIAIPALDTVPVPFMTSLMALERPEGTQVSMVLNSLTYLARGQLAMRAIEGGYDYILWLDSDMVFAPDTLLRLLDDVKDGKEFVSGIYFSRHLPTAPIICKELNVEQSERGWDSSQEVYVDYPKDSVFEIAGSGFGVCITSVELVKKITAAYRMSPFTPIPTLGEDYSFCYRAKECGATLYCDSRIKCGHVGTITYNEEMWLSQRVEK